MTQETALIRCRHCGTRNRIPTARLQEGPRCGRCKHPFPPISVTNRPVIVTDRTFEQEVVASPLPVLLLFWATWCSSCQVILPIVEDLAKQYAGRVKVAKVNVDQNPATSSRHNVLGLPTLMYYRDGKVVDSAAGALPKLEIERQLYRFLAR